MKAQEISDPAQCLNFGVGGCTFPRQTRNIGVQTQFDCGCGASGSFRLETARVDVGTQAPDDMLEDVADPPLVSASSEALDVSPDNTLSQQLASFDLDGPDPTEVLVSPNSNRPQGGAVARKWVVSIVPTGSVGPIIPPPAASNVCPNQSSSTRRSRNRGRRGGKKHKKNQ